MARHEDLTGRKFYRLTLLKFDRIEKLKTYWIAECDCGTIKSMRVDQIKSGNSQSCGCLCVEVNSEYKDITGVRYGRLTALRVSNSRGKQNQIKWICLCECGKEVEVSGHALRSKHTKSCGCLFMDVAREQAIKIGHANKYVPDKYKKEHAIWMGIRKRCLHPNGRYRKKGILMCERWADSFMSFIEDMGPMPGDNYQIDRIDYKGNYKPSNCRWVTNKEQQRNRRSNVQVTYKGQTKCIAEWAEDLGFTTLQLWSRIRKLKWPIEKAMTLPIATHITQKLEYKEYRNKQE